MGAHLQSRKWPPKLRITRLLLSVLVVSASLDSRFNFVPGNARKGMTQQSKTLTARAQRWKAELALWTFWTLLDRKSMRVSEANTCRRERDLCWCTALQIRKPLAQWINLRNKLKKIRTLRTGRFQYASWAT